MTEMLYLVFDIIKLAFALFTFKLLLILLIKTHLNYVFY